MINLYIGLSIFQIIYTPVSYSSIYYQIILNSYQIIKLTGYFWIRQFSLLFCLIGKSQRESRVSTRLTSTYPRRPMFVYPLAMMGQRVSAGGTIPTSGFVGLEPSKWSGRTIRHPRPRNNGRAAEIAGHNSPRDTWLRILTSPLHPRTICYPATASTTDILWSPVPVGIGGISAWNCLTNRNGVPFLGVLYGKRRKVFKPGICVLSSSKSFFHLDY